MFTNQHCIKPQKTWNHVSHKEKWICSALQDWWICHCITTKCQSVPHKFNTLKTKRRLLYLKTQFVPRSKHFHLGYKNQSVYAVSGTSRSLFPDKYKTHKYSVGRTYSCWMLNCWCITWPVGFKMLNTYRGKAADTRSWTLTFIYKRDFRMIGVLTSTPFAYMTPQKIIYFWWLE